MIRIFVDFFKNREIRKKIFFTLAMMLVFRLGAAIPAPGINSTVIDLSSNSILSMMSLLGGGSIEQMSVFSLGVGPYITASIIIQLLSMDIIPPLAEMAKSGKKGKQQLDRITRYLGVVMALLQGFFIVKMFSDQYGIVDDPSTITYIYIAIILTAGTMFLLWIGDQISQKGIGNGVSIIIFAGIVAGFPSSFTTVYNTVLASDVTVAGVSAFAAYIVMFVAIIVLVVAMQIAERRIPVQYSTSHSYNKTKGDLNHLPLKVNSASVIPVIFANALLQGPQIILSWIDQDAYEWLADFLDFSQPYVLVIYAVLIILLTFFYTNMTVDPSKLADDLNKQGTYIPGVRPGAETKEYISKVVNRITVLGAFLLTFIAVLPYAMTIVFDLSYSAAIGGTGIIIVVGVAMETIKQLKGEMTSRSYRGFIGR